jgi:hypothetical protein
MIVRLKSISTGEIKEVSEARWNLMLSDGRSRRFTVLPREEIKIMPAPKPKKEKVEIKPIDNLTDLETNEGTN